MKLTNIEIENYRGIKNKQEIKISDFTTFIGKNDSGKSIVLNAIATFLDNGSYPVFEKDFNNNRDEGFPIIITCTFIDENIREILKGFIKKTKKKDIGIEEELDSILKTENNLIVRKKWNSPDKKPSICEISCVDFEDSAYRNLSQKDDKELNKIIEELNITIPKDKPGRNAKLEKSKYVGDFLVENGYKKIVIWREESKIDEIFPSVEFFPADHAISTDTKFNTSLKTETKDFFEKEQKSEDSKLISVQEEAKKEIQREADEIAKYMKDHVKDLETIQVDPHFNWMDAIKDVGINFKFTKDLKPISMENKGAGYRRLFMVGRFRYLASKNKKVNTLYLVEEPETFLHPSAQQELLDSFLEISKENQVVLTTHSPVFAGSSTVNKIILCKEDGQSIYKQESTESFSIEIINELGIRPSYNLIDNFEKIVFVEGPDDMYFLKKIVEKKLNRSIDSNKILFLFGGGSTLSNFVDIDYFTKSNRNLFLIIDSDKYDESDVTSEQKNSFDRKITEDIDLKNKFEQKPKAKGYILQKRCIENYYHPRAIERAYNLAENTIEYSKFPDDKNIKKILSSYDGIKCKGNKKILDEMKKEEWDEVVETELTDFLQKMID